MTPRLTALLLAGLLLSMHGLAATPPARPAVQAPMRLPDSTVPLGYQLHFTLDPAQPRYSGEAGIDLQLKRAVATLRLHAKGLAIHSVWLESGARRWAGQIQAVDAERVDLRFARPLPVGRARLSLAFTGTLQDKDVYGLFRQQEGGQWMAFTQFEPTGARLALPLFDEPGRKVPWTLSLTVPEALQAVSNTPVASEAPDGPGMKRVRFDPTPPLPSYLLAFGAGAFDYRDAGSTARSGVTMRIVTPRGRAGEADFAAGVTGRIVDRLEAYFDRPYPYAKLDSLAVPVTVNFGAMEHPGLITYAARLLLAQPAEQTPHFERSYVSVAAHELAHQWFGNLVTLAWWDDLWLNESFASWMGDRITAEVMPGWGWETSIQNARSQAMQADRLVSARRIQQPVQRDEDMGNLFDAITYAKGQTVLAMFEGWLGPERFQAGVRRYITRHAGGNATSADFFAALAVDDPALPVALRSFTTQPGIPRIGVALHCDGGAPRLRLTQSRLLPLGSSGAAGPAPRWQVPLRLRTPGGETRLLLTAPEATLALPDAGCPAWVQANADGVGYYRVAYGGDLMSRLAAAPGLPVNEILALLDDAGGLHDAGDIGNAPLLALVQAFAGHPRREVALASADLLQHLRPLVAPAQRAAYAGRWQAAFGDRARALGWLPRPDDSDDDRLLRTRLLPLLADLGEDTALRAQAQQLAQAWLANHAALDAGLRKPVLATAALAGDDTLFEAMLAALRASPHRNERTDLLAALASFRQPALVQRALALLLDAGIDIRESQWPLLGAMADEPAQRAAALAFMAQHHDELVARLGRDEPAWLPSAFESACSADEGRRIALTFGPQAARFRGGRLNLTRTLEAVRLCTAWRAQQTGGL